jgi:hypothetical protein
MRLTTLLARCRALTAYNTATGGDGIGPGLPVSLNVDLQVFLTALFPMRGRLGAHEANEGESTPLP